MDFLFLALKDVPANWGLLTVIQPDWICTYYGRLYPIVWFLVSRMFNSCPTFYWFSLVLGIPVGCGYVNTSISTLSLTGSYALPICSSVRSNEMKTEVLKNRIRFEVRATIPVLLRTVRNNFMKRLNQCIAIKFTSFEWHNFNEKFNIIHLNLRMRIMFRNGNKNVFVAYLCITEFSNFL